MLDPLVFSVANEITRNHVLSARPDAPVMPERPPRRRATAPTCEAPTRPSAAGSTRRAAAGALRRLADRLEPRPTPTLRRS